MKKQPFIYAGAFLILSTLAFQVYLKQQQNIATVIPQEFLNETSVNDEPVAEKTSQVSNIEADTASQSDESSIAEKTLEARFLPIYQDDIPENIKKEMLEHDVMHHEGAHYFQTDFSSFLSAKSGDTVSIELGGATYVGEIEKIVDNFKSYNKNNLVDGQKYLTFYIKPTMQREDISFSAYYSPQDDIKLHIESGRIGEYVFESFDGNGVYLTDQQYWENWEELGIGDID